MPSQEQEWYPFLGCSFLAEAIDEGGADLAIHGHAHPGAPPGPRREAFQFEALLNLC